MNIAASRACLITLIVIGPTLAETATPELLPLLPRGKTLTQEMADALRSGNAERIEAIAGTDRALWLGILSLTRNEPNKAIRTLRRAGYPKALGVAYYMARQYLLFRDEMNEAIRADADDFAPYYYLGRHYDTEVDNAAEAASWLEKALARNRDYLPAKAALGSCLERLGRTAEAERLYNESAGMAQSQTGLARIRFVASDNAGALAFAEKAVALNPRDVVSQKLIARIYAALDRTDEARDALKAAAALTPGDAAIQYQLYRTYKTLGDKAAADAALREFERLRNIYGLRPQ